MHTDMSALPEFLKGALILAVVYVGWLSVLAPLF